MNKKKIKIIGFIPAKKNSQDLKNKNFRKINNLLLFELAILNAKKSKFIHNIYLSSDSDIILKKGIEHKIKIIKRKKSLCTNSASANSIIFDFITNNLKKYKEQNYIIVYLQPTSPFRNNDHIDDAINFFLKKKLKTLLSVTENKNFFKSFSLDKKTLNPFFKSEFVTSNRQKLKKTYSPNGAIYIFYSSDFMKNKKINFFNSGYYTMNKIDSIDIDDESDYEIAKHLSKKYIKIRK
jgi:CMP-N,N'-diacetyllegionaminic acid synthase